MTMDRRRAIVAGAAAGAAALAGLSAAPGFVMAQDQNQTSPRVRRGASTLSQTSDDVMAFAEGVSIMKRRSDNRSWERQNRLHRERAQHGNGMFLPWHRLEVAHLERIIGELTGHRTFALPYWDWQEDRYLPSWVTTAGSPLFERQRAPGVAQLDFAKARWATSRNVARLASDDFWTFVGRLPRGAGNVEAYGHNHIHMLVGGLMGRVETAAQDPVFWLHHCNIDRVWATWHVMAMSGYTSDWSATKLDGFIGPRGEDTGTWSAGQIVETRSLGYRYDRLYPFPVFSVPAAGPPGATRREPLGATTYTLTAEAEPGSGRMQVVLPEEVVQRLRAADDTLVISGVGSVAYARNEALLDRSLEINLAAGARRSLLGSSPTFVHLGGGEHHHGDGMSLGDDYVIGFRFGDEILNLLARDPGAGPGAVTVTVEAEDLTPDLGRGPAQGASLEIALTLTETRWV